MSDQKTFQSYLSSVLSVGVYVDFVPESVTGAAVAYYDIAHDSSRDIEGKKSRKIHTYRVMVVAPSRSELESLIEELENLDNTTSTEYSRIFTQLVNREQTISGQTVRRAFVDVRVKPN